MRLRSRQNAAGQCQPAASSNFDVQLAHESRTAPAMAFEGPAQLLNALAALASRATHADDDAIREKHPDQANWLAYSVGQQLALKPQA